MNNQEVRQNALDLRAALNTFIAIHDNRLYNVELDALNESLAIIDRVVKI
jgi:hypothetical protein